VGSLEHEKLYGLLFLQPVVWGWSSKETKDREKQKILVTGVVIGASFVSAPPFVAVLSFLCIFLGVCGGV
jgi:hypothetical protein